MSDDKPGRRTGQAQGGYWYARAIKASDLPAPARLVALVLASEADNATGKIKMSLGVIAKATGLGRSTVARHLTTLVEAGLLSRHSPQSWQSLGRGEMTEYTLLIPSGYQTKSAPTAHRPSAPTGLGSPRAGLPSPRAGLPLVPETTTSSPALGHTTKGLTSPRSADAGAGVDGLPASPPECSECGSVVSTHNAWCSEYVPILCAGDCGQEVKRADAVMGRTCKACGHQHAYEEYYPPANEADDLKESA